MYPCLSSLLESRLALRIKHLYEEQARAYRIRRDKHSWKIKKFHIQLYIIFPRMSNLYRIMNSICRYSAAFVDIKVELHVI